MIGPDHNLSAAVEWFTEWADRLEVTTRRATRGSYVRARCEQQIAHMRTILEALPTTTPDPQCVAHEATRAGNSGISSNSSNTGGE